MRCEIDVGAMTMVKALVFEPKFAPGYLLVVVPVSLEKVATGIRSFDSEKEGSGTILTDRGGH